MKILKNVYILYVIFFISLLNIGWFVYYNNYNSLITFIVSCLIIYIINHNMIIVLGISIIIVNLLNRFDLAQIIDKKEGFKNPFSKISRQAQERIKQQQRELKRRQEQLLKKIQRRQRRQQEQRRIHAENLEKKHQAQLKHAAEMKAQLQANNASNAHKLQLEQYYKALQELHRLRREKQLEDDRRKIREARAKIEAAAAAAKKQRLAAMRNVRSYNQTPVTTEPQEGFANYSDSEDDDSNSDNENNSDSDNENNSDSDNDDEKSKYMHDKTLIDKIKKLDPFIMNILTNMTHGNIDTINKTLNHITGGNIKDL